MILRAPICHPSYSGVEASASVCLFLGRLVFSRKGYLMDTAMTPLQIWDYTLMVCLGASASLAAFSAVLGVFVRRARLAQSVLLACDEQLRQLLRKRRILLVSGALMAIAGITRGSQVQLYPPPGSRTLYWASIAAANAFYFWLNQGLVVASGLATIGTGFAMDTPLKRANASIRVNRFVGTLGVRLAAAKYHGAFYGCGAICAILVGVFNSC